MTEKPFSSGNVRQSVTVEAGNFSAAATLKSGQCFRWVERNGKFCGTAMGRYVEVSQEGTALTLDGSDQSALDAVWRGYFDLERDYDSIRESVTRLEPRLRDAAAYAAGIHILRQEPWEALCSFIISQNNNIPRIRGIIENLCRHYGQPSLGSEHLSADEAAAARCFPTAEELSRASEEELRAFGCGYRAPYLVELSHRAAAGEIDFDRLQSAPIDEARKTLRSLRGVGPKVAECALLYGCGRLECFPVDVWIRRALESDLAGGSALLESPYAGVAQQYLFEYIRRKQTADSQK